MRAALVERWELKNKTNDKTETKLTITVWNRIENCSFSENRTRTVILQNIETAHHYTLVCVTEVYALFDWLLVIKQVRLNQLFVFILHRKSSMWDERNSCDNCTI